MPEGKTVMPYMYCSRDQIVKFKKHGTFRLLVYGAYNAFGLIGSECNGIAVLSEDRRNVVADEIAKAGSGYFGPSTRQTELFDKMVVMKWPEFRRTVNAAERLRYEL